jgi:carboxyl-terminal processing protease
MLVYQRYLFYSQTNSMNMNTFKKISGISVLSIIVLVIFLSLSACQKDDDTRIRDNKTFHDLMKEWYLWYEQMPSVNSSSYSSPYTLLEALRVYPPDRWSFITTKKAFEDYFQDSKFIGYGFGSAYDTNGKLRISFIYNTVPLYDLGVRRSWIIKSINGTLITGQNINQLLGDNEVGVSNTFVFIKPDGTEVTRTVAKQEVTMNTVLHYEVIDTLGMKIGYIAFQSFTATSEKDLEPAFQLFTSEGVSDLILDMRYNGGGSVDAAISLGSTLLDPSNIGDVFVKYIHNDKKISENSVNFFEQTTYNLNLSRLFVIATSGTASASELIINGLRPYIPVYVVGDDTHGKPTGMYRWFYSTYAFVPVTFKTTNANDEGDFYEGIPADGYAADDTSRAFGDPEEASLQQALHFIVNNSFSGTIQTKSVIRQPWEDFQGLRAIIMSH